MALQLEPSKTWLKSKEGDILYHLFQISDYVSPFLDDRLLISVSQNCLSTKPSDYHRTGRACSHDSGSTTCPDLVNLWENITVCFSIQSKSVNSTGKAKWKLRTRPYFDVTKPYFWLPRLCAGQDYDPTQACLIYPRLNVPIQHSRRDWRIEHPHQF